MHAIRQHTFGDPDVLRLEEVDDPAPAEGQIRIAVEAAGVHLLDTVIRSGREFGPFPPPPLPMTPGREVAGVVDAIGPDVDPSWSGRRVVAHLGAASGGYAELAVVDADRAHAVPNGLASDLAVAAIGTGRTATGILDLAELTHDDVAVTSAAGGLGVLLLQAVRGASAVAIGLTGGPEKVEVARAHGADPAIDYLRDDWIDRIGELGVSPTIVFDAVGGDVGHRAYELLRPGGRLVRYGWTSGEENAYDDPERRVVEVLGPAMLARPGGLASLEAEALARAADGSRVPWVGTPFRLAEAAAAHRALEGRLTHGKVVLVTERGEEVLSRRRG